ncbi:MAG: chemotaxis response regulator protein-glutamate methylesterase [Geobacteraceae bacterium GWC2_58_44]|nr:MAG: chemotaxis response regulator protein-glutamate methylesterase [Geobacteraceae bacterium GWC2_58_44]HBG04187.1 chemotaxis response regulator protein-glutamate methylesterase [Geobacter sp.]
MTINILLADDSGLVRQVLTDMLHQSPDIRVVGCACNGSDAVDLTLSLKPDLVIMDLVMPVMDGLAAIEEIMSVAPTPVLVLSAAVEATELSRAFHAIKRGALDVMEKPAVDIPGALDDFRSRLQEKVRLLSGIRVIRHPRRRLRSKAPDEIGVSGPVPKLLAIGASTGGPKAVMSLLKTLPADFPATVFVVQHIADGFAEGFATWLDRECAISVRIAVDGAKYGPGEAVVAPGSSHMTISDGRIRLRDDPPVNCCRPSIDVFFNSLAQTTCNQVVSLLLTGMGKDGAQGLLRIKERGGTTLVQDENSCAVFGMPKEAIKLNAVDRVLPLECMPAAISKLFAVR